MNIAGTVPVAFMRRTRSSLIKLQCVIFGRASAPRKRLLRALDRREHHVDRDVAVGVAVHLDARAMHALDPRVEIVLRLGDVAFVGRRRCRRTAR